MDAVNQTAEALTPADVARGGFAWGVTFAAVVPLALYVCALLATRTTDIWEAALCSLLVAAPAASGWLVVQRSPGNRVGWLLVADAALMAVGFTPDVYVQYSFAHGGQIRGTALAVYANESLWLTWFIGVTAIAWVFPDGHLPSPRWRPWAWAASLCCATFLVLALFSHDTPSDPLRADYVNPLPELPVALQWFQFAMFVGVVASLIGAVAAVRIRLRRASGAERMQLLWFSWASLTIPGALVLCVVESLLNGGKVGVVTLIGVVLMATMIPVAIGVALLRYRLFDIELVLSRTLVYGLLTLFVAAVYAGIVAGFGSLIGSTTGAGVVGAGVVAVLVQPVHARLQRRVGRWVYGDRNDPYAALQRVDERLRETQTPAEAVHAVVESVAESLRLPYAAIEFDRGDERRTLAAHGVRGRGEIERRVLTHRGETVGSLVVEVPRGRPLAPADEQLLDRLASHVGAPVQAVRLTEDLQASRKQIVTAREEERRRLRRDLHDGVGPTLAAMSLQLDVLRDGLGGADGEIADQLGAQVQEAIADIRRLVYELRPPALDQYGLVSALREQAARLSGPAASFRVHALEPMPALPAAVEVAAYRIALEAMTNAARHSGCRHCNVTIELGAVLTLSVEDDGVGVDRTAPHGVGLRSMRERTAELGGALVIDAAVSGGTRLVAELPLEPA